mmetsp:Transcript_4331/g.4783  ORF Transcript_4331/g.4783 Transcript_4331/m.4783 type:complete len:241 (+) Transcript_4331:1054-1776(+)
MKKVASLDPLLVLYQDGFVRIGYSSIYPMDTTIDDETASFKDFSDFLWHVWEQQKSFYISELGINDPVIHVRNQLKEAITTFVEGYHDSTLLFSTTQASPSSKKIDDAFELMAMEFMIDNEMDVHFMSVPTDTTYDDKHYSLINEDYYFLLQKNHELYYSMIMTLEEIWNKQKVETTAIVPLFQTGKFELIVAGKDWKFTIPHNDKHHPHATKTKRCTLQKESKQYPSVSRVMKSHPSGW